MVPVCALHDEILKHDHVAFVSSYPLPAGDLQSIPDQLAPEELVHRVSCAVLATAAAFVRTRCYLTRHRPVGFESFEQCNQPLGAAIA